MARSTVSFSFMRVDFSASCGPQSLIAHYPSAGQSGVARLIEEEEAFSGLLVLHAFASRSTSRLLGTTASFHSARAELSVSCTGFGVSTALQ